MNLLSSPRGRKILFGSLYLSEGAPIGYVWWALPAKLADAGISPGRITAITSLLVLPWALKVLWAPLVDVLRSPRWGFRSWIVASQIAMGLTLLPLLRLDLSRDMGAIQALLIVHAFAAATQDVAIDGLSIATVPSRERGALNGWMQAGLLLGRALFGGAAIIVESRLGGDVVILALVSVTWASLALVLLSRESEDAVSLSQGWRSLRAALNGALRSRVFLLGLVFAGAGGAAYEGAGAVASPLLLDLGLTKESIGWMFLIAVPAATAAGALGGGTVSDRVGRRLSVGLFQALCVGCVLFLAGIAAWWPSSPSIAIAAMVALYLAIGLFTASSYALFMDLTDKRMGATQFSAFMGMTNGCEAWAGRTTGALVDRRGYGLALAAMGGVSLCALAIVPFLRPLKSPPPRPGPPCDSPTAVGS